MVTTAPVEQARRSFHERAWGDAFMQLTAAADDGELEPEDLDRLAVAAYLTGHDAESADAWAGAHRGWLAGGEPRRAARSAFWLGLTLLLKGDMAPANGWLERAQSIVDKMTEACAERGYLLVPGAMGQLEGGEADAAQTVFEEALELGQRFADADLCALGRLGTGQALLHLGDMTRGLSRLDEMMVGVTTDEVSPLLTGILYCAVIEACQEVFDLRRAREWTTALTRWCEAQPELVMYRGQCLVHRAEILQHHGQWRDALDEARRACARLSDPPGQAARGAAFYQEAELRRLRGDFAGAEHGYRQASKWGHDPQPGLALLRLAQGRVDAAATAIRRVLDEAADRLLRARVLGPFVEISVAAGDVDAATEAAAELTTIAAELDAPLLDAIATHATGAAQLAHGDVNDALVTLRRAWRAWCDLEEPYEAARVRVLLGMACAAVGDTDSADLELDAAREEFASLGAAPDLAAVDELRGGGGASRNFRPLTAREAEVVTLVARGATNRAIAEELVISEKTVARHLANVFTKLGVSSRAAATAWAYEHGLVERTT